MRKTKRNTKLLFTEKNYNNNNGFLTTVWGPAAWHFIHTISFNYPVKPTASEKNKYREFILNLENILPCGKCRKNLNKNFKKLPLKIEHMASRHAFSHYVYNLHELINTMLGKNSHLSYDDVRDRYEHFRARCARRKNKTQKRKTNSEKGCMEPLFGKKSKCVINIVPQTTKTDTFNMDKKCILTKE